MKLLLTSAGLKNKKVTDFFSSILPKAPKDCSIIMVAYALKPEEQFYIDESKKELVDLGINEITTFNLKEENFNLLQTFDIIYVCGGNTFAILDRMRKTGIDKYIIEKTRNGNSLYFGVSAGSIIAGPNLFTAGWGSEGDSNKVDLKDLSGFKFTDISILPHFKYQLAEELENLKKKVDYTVIGLTDEEAIYIDDVGHTVIR